MVLVKHQGQLYIIQVKINYSGTNCVWFLLRPLVPLRGITGILTAADQKLRSPFLESRDHFS
jgi:hypothetical protein